MRNQRSGFTLIVAIFLLVALSSMMAIMISYTTQTSSQTKDIYLKEQAQLLAKSATEFALLAISGHDRTATGNCVNQINATYSPDSGSKLFDINTTIRYIGLGSIAGCSSLNGAGAIATAESNGTVLIDVYVTATDTNPPIRYHRRTLQKP